METKAERLPAPANLINYIASDHYVIIRWDKVEGAQSYNVYKDGGWYTNTKNNQIKISVVTGDVYTISVCALDVDRQEGAYTDQVKIKQKADSQMVLINNQGRSTKGLMMMKYKGEQRYPMAVFVKYKGEMCKAKLVHKSTI